MTDKIYKFYVYCKCDGGFNTYTNDISNVNNYIASKIIYRNYGPINSPYCIHHTINKDYAIKEHINNCKNITETYDKIKMS